MLLIVLESPICERGACQNWLPDRYSRPAKRFERHYFPSSFESATPRKLIALLAATLGVLRLGRFLPTRHDRRRAESPAPLCVRAYSVGPWYRRTGYIRPSFRQSPSCRLSRDRPRGRRASSPRRPALVSAIRGIFEHP